MTTILVVEDDSSLALGMEYTLKAEGFNVILAKNASKGYMAIENENFHLAILDIMLPDGSGYDLCKKIREKSDIPIVFLTACDEEVNVVMGLDMGADDYITKPFRVKELVSRIKAVLRRSNSTRLEYGSRLVSDDIVLYPLQNKVKRHDKELMVTPNEFKLLLLLLEHPRQVLPRDVILERLWDEAGNFVDDNTLSVYIRRLREKIEDTPGDPKYILTIRGIGYKWGKDVIKR
ncbi:MAG: response regulator transcription factor [Clostridiales bacterium]|nr:response regulator transcription factor [Clostridiales bacterium]